MHERLNELNACREGKEYAAQYGTLQEAWDACANAEWMLWLLVQTAKLEDKKRYVRLACQFARQALPLAPPGEDRPRLCIETVERWLDGNATMDEVNAAKAAAWAASDASDAARAAARAAAWAAASDAAWAARAAASDAAWAARAASDAASDAQCKIIRAEFPQVPC